MATPTSAKAWKAKTSGIELTLPSGNVCLVKRPGLEAILSSGVIPDELSSIAMDTIKAQAVKPQDHKKPGDASALSPEDFAATFKTTEDIFRMMDSFDRITEMVVMEPAVVWHKREVIDPETGKQMRDAENRILVEVIPDPERDSSEDAPLYTDEVDMDDKMFIFNFVVGGSADLEQFRKEFGDSLESLPAVEDMGDEAQSAVGTL